MKTKLLSLFFIAQSFIGLAQDFSGKNLVTSANNNVEHFEFEDMDQDGDIDILAASSVSNHVFWYKNEGGEIFSAKILISSDYSDPNTIKALDIDEDGKKDIVVGEDDNGISWIKNMGGGLFGTKQGLPYNSFLSSFEVGDVDNDGKQDIIAAQLSSDFLYWLRNTGNGVFVGTSMFYVAPTGTNIYSYEFADLDQDNVQDLIVSTGSTSSQAIIQFEYVNGAFVQTPVYSSATTPYVFNSFLADLDNDDKVDVVTRGSDCNVYWLKNLGANAFSDLNQIGMAACDYNRISSVGDLDMDGTADLVYTVDADLKWRENLGDGTVSTTLTAISVGAIVGVIDETSPFDIDGDGDLDIFYITGDEFGWFENNAAQLSAVGASKAKVSVYPNPANAELNILSDTEFEMYKIYDSTGKLVTRADFSSPVSDCKIDTANLGGGLYFLEIQSGSFTLSKKFIKK